MASSRVFVTGATGFVGRAVVTALRANDHSVRCLVRRGSELHLRGLSAVERVEGDVLHQEGLADEMSGCAAVIHLVGSVRETPSITFDRLHVEGTTNVLDAATAAGVQRLVHMSALGARPDAAARYHRTKWAAEELVRDRALRWTVVRPSLIYGRGDHVVSTLARMARRLPAVPVVGTGRQRLQPVVVETIASAITRALDLPGTERQTYDAAGPDVVSMEGLIQLVGETLGMRHVRTVHVPLRLLRPLTGAWRGLPRAPLTRDQLAMLQDDTVCDPTPFHEAFELTPVPLQVGLERMLAG